MKVTEINPVELKVFLNHIYEYKKGVRQMVLYTTNKKYKTFAINRLKSQRIPFVIQPVDEERINLFFGKAECINAIRLMVTRPLNLLSPEEDFIFFWIRYFDLDCDYSEYINMINPRDKYLTAAGEMGSGIRILQQDLWEMIISFLISQQNNITRIKKCIENISREFGVRKTSSTGAEYYAFPTAEALALATEEQLRECNLGYRAKYVLDTARKVCFGDISLNSLHDMTYKAARKELLGLYGVGEKVADCICLFGLHQLDAFPVDTHIRQALDAHYKRGFPNRRYKGCRGVMQQYIFYYELMK